MIKAGVIGGTGYTGVELLRLLGGHPEATPCLITSRTKSGTQVA
ncbi:MAG TPA: N-acetyl-gamma-glutamyl-phosphate reductase, partial [Arenicellales bacterium]|nr:N-acetyl-gamma-glutamyl-phosphate reductase [Arenicellales bacterium]